MKKKIIISVVLLIIIIISLLGAYVYLKNKDSNNSLIKEDLVAKYGENYQSDISDIKDLKEEDFVDENETIKDDEIVNTLENTEQNKRISTDKLISNTTTKNGETEEQKTNEKSQTQETKQNANYQITVNAEKSEQNNKSNTQTTNSNKQNQSTSTKKIDLSKYSYYEKNPNGSYKGFIEDSTEINKLKSLINENLKFFGYNNVKVIVDKSLSRDGTPYFTANNTNVKNAIYNCEGFSIYYYAVKEYSISAEGNETYFQTRSYIKVK